MNFRLLEYLFYDKYIVGKFRNISDISSEHYLVNNYITQQYSENIYILDKIMFVLKLQH